MTRQLESQVFPSTFSTGSLFKKIKNRNFLGQKPDDAGVHLLLELLLSPKSTRNSQNSPRNYEKPKVNTPKVTTTKKATTTTTPTTKAPDFGGFGGVVEQQEEVVEVTTVASFTGPDNQVFKKYFLKIFEIS